MSPLADKDYSGILTCEKIVVKHTNQINGLGWNCKRDENSKKEQQQFIIFSIVVCNFKKEYKIALRDGQ